MAFDPSALADESSYEGHLDRESMSSLLATMLREKVTGRITIRDENGANYLYFMQGRPVGVVLSQVLHPLGQLLLELGKVDSAQFVKAQRLIGDGERLPGQVFIEIGAINEAELKETLAIQARRKAQKFVGLRGLPFEVNKGLSFLTGFKSSPMEGPPLVFHAITGGMDLTARDAYLKSMGARQVRARSTTLPAALDAYGFGRAEERFMQRLGEWHTIQELDQFGTLPREDIAGLLRYLDEIGQLEIADPGVSHKRKEVPAPPPPAPEPPPRPLPVARPAPTPPPAAARDKGKPGAYSPNSAVQVTQKARDIGEKPREEKALPSVMVDFDALGVPPGQKR